MQYLFLKSASIPIVLLLMCVFGMGTALATEPSTPVEKPKLGEFVWNELATNNVQAAKDFYGKVFGWKFTDKTIGDMTYTMIKTTGQDFAGIWAIPEDQKANIPPHWLSYVLVENLEQSLSLAIKNGAKLVKPISTAGDYGRFAIIQDPAGAHLALWQPLMKK